MVYLENDLAIWSCSERKMIMLYSTMLANHLLYNNESEAETWSQCLGKGKEHASKQYNHSVNKDYTFKMQSFTSMRI